MLASSQLRASAFRKHSGRSCRTSQRAPLICTAAARPSASSAPALSAAAAAAVAALIQFSSAGVSIAAPLYDNLPGFGGESSNVFYQAVRNELQQREPDVDDIFDENLMTEDLRKFVDNVLDGKLKPERYQDERLKLNFRREQDGRVTLRSREGRWFSVRPDMQVPGFLLIRDQSGGVFFLPPDTEGDGLVQLDLSDDVVVAQLFSNTAWQDVMAPLSTREADGTLRQLSMSEQQFREVVSLLEGAEEPEQPEEEEAAAAGTAEGEAQGQLQAAE